MYRFRYHKNCVPSRGSYPLERAYWGLSQNFSHYHRDWREQLIICESDTPSRKLVCLPWQLRGASCPFSKRSVTNLLSSARSCLRNSIQKIDSTQPSAHALMFYSGWLRLENWKCAQVETSRYLDRKKYSRVWKSYYLCCFDVQKNLYKT